MAATLAATVDSCSADLPENSGSAFMRIMTVPEGMGTRSVLEETGEFEDRVNSMTIAAFDSNTGYLVGCAYPQAGNWGINLPTDRTYRIYLLANMGDQTGMIPAEASGMEGFRYDLVSYSRLKENGLPMVCDTLTAWKPELTLDLRRLMAKLAITVDKGNMSEMGGGGEEAFRNHRIAVHRIVRILTPFAEGGSAAQSEADFFTLDEVEYDTFSDATAEESEEMLLYVPENVQDTGLVGKELCTYVSMSGRKDGSTDGVYGDLVYRFIPGSDKASGFGLKGGKRYDITLKLTWNGMYAEGDWKVERSGWRDNRRILVSLAPDKGYVPAASVSLAKGSSAVPVYVYYSPQGKDYAEGEANHHEKGWTYFIEEPAGDMMSTGLVEHTLYRSIHYVTIPATTSSGYENAIYYATMDEREKAVLKIRVAEPVIEFAPASMLFLFHEYGYASRQAIRISPASPVRPCNITVYTPDDDLITLGPFNRETGKVEVYWNDTNTSSNPKTAKVYLHSEACSVTAVCTLTQQSRPDLSVDEEIYGNDVDIEY